MIGDLSDPSHPVPDMLAPHEQFAQAMGRLGVGANTLVIAYDNMEFPLGSARLWWALKHYGHDRVSVLDGGLRQWQKEQRPISNEVPVVQPAAFVPTPRPGWIAPSRTWSQPLDERTQCSSTVSLPNCTRVVPTAICGDNVRGTFRAR